MARKDDGSPDFDLIVDPKEVVMHSSAKGEEIFINLQNPCGHAVLFKVKCTDNRKFKIRPSMGSLDSNGTSQVKIARTEFDIPPPKRGDFIGVFWAFPIAPDTKVSEQWQTYHPPDREHRKKIKWEP